jgi:anti-anti-sigma factor
MTTVAGAGGLKVSVATVGGGWQVRPVGEIDCATADQLRAALDAADGPVVLDCSGVAFIDAAGLGVVASASKSGRTMLLIGTSAFLRRVLHMVGMEDLVAADSLHDE